MPQPEHVHAWYGGDGFDVPQTLGRLDLADDEGARIRHCYLVRDRATHVVVMGDAERGASLAKRRVARRRDDKFSLLFGVDHRNHDAHRSRVQRARNEMVLRRGNTDQRRQTDAAAQRELGFHGSHLGSAVLHVEKNEIGAGRLDNLRESRRKEFEGERAESITTLAQLPLDGVVAHCRSPHIGSRYRTRAETRVFRLRVSPAASRSRVSLAKGTLVSHRQARLTT